ncbi:hypothetical protein ACPA9J_28140 [Pseudomonas aeruginosa]
MVEASSTWPSVAAGARPGGGVHGLARQTGGGALGVDHHFGAAPTICFGGVELGIAASRQALHRERHAGGRQGVLAGVMGQVASQPGDVGSPMVATAVRLPGSSQGNQSSATPSGRGQAQRQPADAGRRPAGGPGPGSATGRRRGCGNERADGKISGLRGVAS